MLNITGRADVERFRGIIAARLGLQFDEDKLDIVADVLRSRLRERGKISPSLYFSSLESGHPERQELRALASQLTIAETYFFRGADHFRAFSEAAFPERMRVVRAHLPLRILSAGCASGDEAYSLAIELREQFPQLSPGKVAITGIDINPVVLTKARQAEYSEWSLRGTDAELRQRYFRANSHGYSLDDRIRALVRFEEGNVAVDDGSTWGREKYDVVFCRNVIMYLVPEAARAAVARLTEALAPGGFLFLGHAETLRGISQDFHLRHTHDAFYYQKRDDATLAPAAHINLQPMPAIADIDVSWVEAVRRASERIESLSGDARRHAALTNSGGAAIAGAPVPSPRGVAAQLGSAVDLLRREKFGPALDALSDMPPDLAAGRDAQLLRAVFLTNSGHIGIAEAVCRQLLASDELNASAHYVTALCREHAQDIRGAMEHDCTALYIDPLFSMPHLHLGLLHKRAGNLDSACRELEQADALLLREDASRILLLGGGFSREALIEFCRAQLRACGGGS